MKARLVRFWRRERAGRPDAGAAVSHHASLEPASPAAGAEAGRALPAPESAPEPGLVRPPEQPVMIAANGERQPVHVGEVLPAPSRRWPLALVRVPTVPKRAILAAGVCAGLAAPQIARHLATRILLGSAPAASGGAILEVTRIVYTGPLTQGAAAAIGKAIEASRR